MKHRKCQTTGGNWKKGFQRCEQWSLEVRNESRMVGWASWQDTFITSGFAHFSITWGSPMARQTATVIPMLSPIHRLTAWMQPRTWMLSCRLSRWYTQQRKTISPQGCSPKLQEGRWWGRRGRMSVSCHLWEPPTAAIIWTYQGALLSQGWTHTFTWTKRGSINLQTPTGRLLKTITFLNLWLLFSSKMKIFLDEIVTEWSQNKAS